MDAPGRRPAGVLGARVGIVAIEWTPACAHPHHTYIARGAGVPIAAWRRVQQILATELWVTKIVGARIVVATIGCARSRTRPVLTLVAKSADIAVVAGFGVKKDLTAHSGITKAVGTRVVVIAVEQ